MFETGGEAKGVKEMKNKKKNAFSRKKKDGADFVSGVCA